LYKKSPCGENQAFIVIYKSKTLLTSISTIYVNYLFISHPVKNHHVKTSRDIQDVR